MAARSSAKVTARLLSTGGGSGSHGSAVRRVPVPDDVEGLEHLRARVRILEIGDLLLAGALHEGGPARAALAHVVEHVRELQLAEHLAHPTAVRRELERPQLQRLVGRAATARGASVTGSHDG